jgi:conflict system STAND superfamily ATPase
MICGPARVAGVRISDELVATLVEDTGDGAALPFLSFVMSEMTQDVVRGGELTIQQYRELGGVKRALGKQADRALAQAMHDSGLDRDRVLQKLTEFVTIDDFGAPLRRRRRIKAEMISDR